MGGARSSHEVEEIQVRNVDEPQDEGIGDSAVDVAMRHGGVLVAIVNVGRAGDVGVVLEDVRGQLVIVVVGVTRLISVVVVDPALANVGIVQGGVTGAEVLVQGIQSRLRMLYQQAADRGSAEAQTYLGTLYEYGDGVEQSYVKAAELYQLAADQGDALAQAYLGLLYEFGDGVDLSYEKALEYFQLSANQGNSVGQWGMGQLYQFGLGVDLSYTKAVEYYQLSADQNDPDGLECLGYLYLEGLGVEQSTDRAMELYRLAAALGSEEAQRQLAILEN